MARRYLAGDSYYKIAEFFTCYAGTIGKIVRKAGITPRTYHDMPSDYRAAQDARLRKVQKLGTASAVRSNRRTETRLCTYCKKPITRQPSRFKRSHDNTYCNRACSNRGRTKQTITDE